tara:strand:- start:16 stop:186 length:171 start_codon:yes stop_codon:yes gene_type:complete
VLIQTFDVLDKAAGYDRPHPIIFAIDPKGTITHRFSPKYYTERPAVQEVLQALRSE